MKVLYSIIILFISLISCKQESKKEDVITTETKKAVVEQTKEVLEPEKETQSEKQTIEEFLTVLQIAIKNKNNVAIAKSLKFPLEFNSGSGGESSFYDNYDELKKEKGVFGIFLNVKNGKYIGKEEGFYIVEYSRSETSDYFNTYYLIKEKGLFKVVKFEQPH